MRRFFQRKRGTAPDLSEPALSSPEQIQLFVQSVRRSHEFEILTQIGTSLSSSLDTDALLALIHGQLQKLMDVRNFYVAFEDAPRQQIRFAFEVEDGQRVPPRSRARTNALTEHILATGKPLLASGDVAAYGRVRGLAPSGRDAKCYLGVPIIVQGRTQGVLAVQSNEREDAYDDEHLHILEILASQAAVALDNARLFAEVQRDARQKTFLNHIARLTISSLSPAEMLDIVANELARAFHYDHVWVAVPRRSAVPLIAAPGPEAELELVACAGGHELHQGEASIPPYVHLGAGLGGQAALDGEIRLVSAFDPAPTPNWARCPASLSGVGIPIRYGGETLALLWLENHSPEAFPMDQRLVLETLADQIAVALNHANLFQQIQHQAITDSLTGLKTRRFFMEALQAEWRRAQSAHDSFCVILIDLDNFKPLNDTFGHAEGDRILNRVGQVLEQRCRASSIVARYGGDEFTILVPACDRQAAEQLLLRLEAAVASDAVLVSRRLRASFGAALYPDQGTTPDELLHRADANMYTAKQQNHRA